MLRNITCFGFLFLLLCVSVCWADTTEVSLTKLENKVDVYRDSFGVPHIYASSWTDASRVLGYVHASDRLWEMDLFRRRASGRAAEVLGERMLASDIQVRQLGIRRGCEELWASDKVPAEMRRQLKAYCEGVNAKIEELGTEGLPPMFGALGYAPEKWEEVDCIVFGKYMGWDQSGTEDDLWLGTMVDKLGVATVEQLWPLDRPYEIPSIKVQVNRTPGKALKTGLQPILGETAAYQATMETMDRAGWFSRSDSFGSNNWVVDGTKTKSGKPMLCNDPHLGFSLPLLWYTCHLSVAEKSVVGVTFPGSPIVVIGHNDSLGWGITNMQSDSVDFFVETMHPDDSTRYRHCGEWKKVSRRTEEIRIQGKKPLELHIDSTVHGPIINRKGRFISMQWTGLGPTTEMVGFWEMNFAEDLDEFLKAADKIVVPAINLAYADVHGTIATHSCGALPLRGSGEGRIPMDGASGEFDWKGMIPRGELPLAVNPAEHYITSANGRPAGKDYPHYLGWMWDPSYRVRRINDMLSKAENLDVDSMSKIQNDYYDKAAERFVPVLLKALEGLKLKDVYSQRLKTELKNWDYHAGPTSIGPMIWLRWLDLYRKGVWEDEWKSRGITMPGGSWGFTGNNGREPMLEVLEYLTREEPDSIWFDDPSTPKRENRDEIMLRAFAETAKQLQTQFGEDTANLEWGRINRLKVTSLAGQSSLDREGGPIGGTGFTVNPGGRGGVVGGGASFRLMVDFGDVGKSVGVYPAGQNENPRSPHYDDQIQLWAQGKYLNLYAVGQVERLPKEVRQAHQRFTP